MIITVTNNFHNTTAKMRLKTLPGIISPQTVIRIQKKLCGIKDCTCSGPLGDRGPQFIGDQKITFEYLKDGSIRVNKKLSIDP